MSKAHVRAAKAAMSDLEGIKAKLEEAHGALTDSIDGKSDRWRESENGEKAQAEASNIEDAINELDNAINSLGEVGADD